MLFCEGRHPAVRLPSEAGRPGRREDRAAARTVARQPAAAVARCGAAGPGASSLKEAVRAETERVERELIQKALDETGGNVTQAARKLEDHAQEPADEDEGAGPAHGGHQSLVRPGARQKSRTGNLVVLSSGTALAAATFKKMSVAGCPFR